MITYDSRSSSIEYFQGLKKRAAYTLSFVLAVMTPTRDVIFLHQKHPFQTNQLTVRSFHPCYRDQSATASTAGQSAIANPDGQRNITNKCATREMYRNGCTKPMYHTRQAQPPSTVGSSLQPSQICSLSATANMTHLKQYRTRSAQHTHAHL